MVHRIQSSLLLIIGVMVIFGAFSLNTSVRAADEPIAISCPNKQTTFLSGDGGPPSESLIVYLNARPVGGGVSRSNGSWWIPIQVNERPGIYPVQVKMRSNSRVVVGNFLCYVDVPITTPTASSVVAQTTRTATIAPPSVVPTTTSIPTTTTTPGTPTKTTPTVTTTPGTATKTTTPGTATKTTTAGTATKTTTAGTATKTTTAGTATKTTTPGTATATTTAGTPTTTTTSQPIGNIKIDYIVCRDPSYPDNFEYVDIANTSATTITMTGWRLVNASRANVTYTFPTYTIGAGPTYVTLYSGFGDDWVEPGYADFYWDRNEQLWFIGDRAELYDAAGHLMDVYTIPSENCTF